MAASAREEIRSNATVRRYRISYNVTIVVNDSRPFAVVEIPRNGYSIVSEAELDARELLAFVAAELEPDQLLVNGKPSTTLIGLVELIVHALSRAAEIQYDRVRRLEHVVDHGDWLEICRVLGELDVVVKSCGEKDEERLRELALKKLDEERSKLESLRKLLRIANVLLTGLRVGKPYLDYLEIRINAPEYEGPLKKLLNKHAEAKAKR